MYERVSENAAFPYDAILVTARKRSLGQGNIFTSVCQEFCSQGVVCLSACWDTTPLPPSSRHPPPGPGTPPGPDTPLHCMLGDTVNKRAVCILLECNLVLIKDIRMSSAVFLDINLRKCYISSSLTEFIRLHFSLLSKNLARHCPRMQWICYLMPSYRRKRHLKLYQSNFHLL